MALGQGSISLGGTIAGESIALELGLTATAQISLNDTTLRALAVKTGDRTSIDMLSFRGKSSSINEATTSAHKQNLNIYNEAVAVGWDKKSAFVYTIGAGSYIWSDSTSLPALTTGGAFPGGLTIYNGGYIMGKGGNGGNMIGSNAYTGGTPGSGGVAISLTTACTIVNNGYIGGGGGGGGAGASNVYNSNSRIYIAAYATGGGGAGGGAGGAGASSVTFAGAVGGAIGTAGGQCGDFFIGGGYGYAPWPGGGAGGRIMPGVGGAAVSTGYNNRAKGNGGGAGGSGASAIYNVAGGGGGSGGAAGANGATRNPGGGAATATGGGGGGWGASGGNGYGQGGGTSTAGAAGGYAISKNGYTVTTSGAGTTYGAIL